MKLYLVTQPINTGYDTYDSAVIAAECPAAARFIHPSPSAATDWWKDDPELGPISTWAKPEHLLVYFLGYAKRGTKPGVICASFNAG